MPLHLIRDDITRISADAIVNAANERLRMGGGVCGAIFRAAGAHALQQACDRLGDCPTGSAVITPGFALPARYVIHAVGPIWQGGGCGERQLLSSCYLSALRLAKKHELGSIAFPLISAGIYGYPKEEALRVAVETIRTFLQQEDDGDLEVQLVLFQHDAYAAGHTLYGAVKSFLGDDDPRLQVEQMELRRPDFDALPMMDAEPFVGAAPCAARAMSAPSFDAELAPVPGRAVTSDDDMADAIGSWAWNRAQHEESFTDCLLRLIDERGETDAAVYKRANLDRRLFSKIRSSSAYQPSKNTVLALCLALEMDVGAAEDFLQKAGYALSRANRRDLVILYCLDHGIHDVFDVNALLFDLDLPALGA